MLYMNLFLNLSFLDLISKLDSYWKNYNAWLEEVLIQLVYY
jgi:hypothetical protein